MAGQKPVHGNGTELADPMMVCQVLPGSCTWDTWLMLQTWRTSFKCLSLATHGPVNFLASGLRVLVT
jgi:hypothetical protein